MNAPQLILAAWLAVTFSTATLCAVFVRRLPWRLVLDQAQQRTVFLSLAAGVVVEVVLLLWGGFWSHG